MNLNFNYRPGKRVFKTVLAVAITMVYGVALGRSPVIAGVSAIICMKPTSSESLRTMYMRLLSTLIGGLLGLAAASLGLLIPGYEHGWCILVVPAFMLLCIYICNVMDAKDTIVLSCVVLMVVGTAFELGPQETFLYALGRLLDTGVGAVSATLVNVLIWRNDHKNDAAAQNDPAPAGNDGDDGGPTGPGGETP